MKNIILLGDGMADEPIAVLGGKTPLQYAHTPYMDHLATIGQSGLLQTVAPSFHPGSEVANMAVLGYDMPTVYEGRGVLEAASIGVELQPGDVAMRCNLVCIEGALLKSHSSGHITTEESALLIEALNDKLASERVQFYTGVSYRHLLVIKGGDKRVACVPPHDVPLHPFRPLLPKAEEAEAEDTASLLNQLIADSQAILSSHPVNLRRVEAGKDAANCVWPWSLGFRPAMQTLQALYGIERSAVISAVDLIQGIGIYAGMEVIKVEGATGLYDTNYAGKVAAALKALETDNLVYLHVEASDEAGHEGDIELKIKTIEDFDSRIVKPIVEALADWSEPVSIAVLPDHPTPCELRTHTATPVPFVIYKPGAMPDGVTEYDEESAQQGVYGLLKENEFMYAFLK
jgi:2,3-bisphosphoglycerate-independent phosphoglycerate mutase